jgi:hypothetical protein
VGNPTGDTTIAMDAGEEVNFQFTGNFTTGTQFLIQQLTGNPSGGVLFEVRGADPDPALARFGDGTNYVQISNTGGMTLAGTASITAGGIILGDSTPDASGEIGYASNAFSWYANSEDMVATASTNLWTFSSATGATFAFTPSVGFSAGMVVADGQKIVFDESAADPNDADIELSASDGVFKIAATNGANNEDLTIDLDQTANTVIIGSSTGVTSIGFGSIGLVTTGAILGGVNIISSSSNPYALSAANAYGSAIFCTGTMEIDLPAGATGMAILIYNTGAYTITVDPNGSEVIVRDGTTQSGGISFTLSSGAGNYVALIHNGTNWYTLGYKGTLAQGS